MQSQGIGSPPSLILGLTQGSYEAYCLDQAVWYLGVTIQNELEEVGIKKSKESASHERERKAILAKYLGVEEPTKGGFADPAAFFS